MKKRRLKRWVKVAITLLVLFTGFIVYMNLRNVTCLSNKDGLKIALVLLGWFWIVLGQILTLIILWEEN